MLFQFRQLPTVLAIVEGAGGSTDGLLQTAGLDESILDEAVPEDDVDKFEALLAECARRSRMPAFGVELGKRVPRGRFAWVEFGLRSASTLADAVQMLCRYGALVNRHAAFTSIVQPTGSTLEHQVSKRRGGWGPHLNEFTVALLAKSIGELLGRAFTPARVWFAHDQATDERLLAEYFACPMAFGAATSGMLIPTELVNQPISADPALHALVRTRLDELMPLADRRHPVSARVRTQLLESIGRDEISIPAIAKALGLGARSLQRALAQEQRSFQELVDEARRTLAETLLARDELSIDEIAALLGYAATRGFDRAFKRWTGSTPSAFRSHRAHGRDPGRRSR